MREHNQYIDIIKGLSIISIVIGHSCWNLPYNGFPIGSFVYTYHIMTFIFVAGMCVNKVVSESKDTIIGRQISKQWILYMLYSCIAILFHNCFLELGIIPQEARYGIREIITRISNAAFYMTTEYLLPALWFVPFYIVALLVFKLILLYTNIYKKVGLYVICIFCGITGIILCYKQVYLIYHLQTALLSMPIILIGYKAGDIILNKDICGGMINYVIIGVGLAFGLWKIVEKFGSIDLAVNVIASPILFYPITFAGIAFCLILAKIINRISVLSRIIEVLGKYSFHIMALHIICFKLVDYLYCVLVLKDTDALSAFPHSFYNWIVYLYWITGTGLPVLSGITFQALKKLWKNRHLTSDNIQNDNGFFFSNRDI